MHSLPSTLLIRQTKRKPKIGMPLAVQYRNNVFDPVTHIEALIEAYGAANVQSFVNLVEARRNEEQRKHPENFKPWRL